MSQTSDRYKGFSERYFEEISTMIAEYDPVNLGKGMPDYNAYPQSLMNQLVEVATNERYNSANQYTDEKGLPKLINVLAKLYSFLLNANINYNHILVTSGAFEAIYCSVFGLLNNLDEVIIIDPHYDPYDPIVKAAGGVPVHIAVNRVVVNGDTKWILDFDELESKFNDKTRLIIVNTPQNPIGKVYTKQELQRISELCKQFNVIAVMDEVYEWITYDNNKHFRLATIPGMFERSITIGSAGKAFHTTGWKCGWAVTGDPEIMKAISLAHSYCVSVVPTILQEAIARTLELEVTKLVTGLSQELYWTQMSETLKHKRDFVYKMFTSIGLNVSPPEGGYYMIVDCKSLIEKLDLNEFQDKRGKTFAFVKWLSKRGLQVIPLSVFYSKQYNHLSEGLVRICFIKCEQTLNKALSVLENVKDMVEMKSPG